MKETHKIFVFPMKCRYGKNNFLYECCLFTKTKWKIKTIEVDECGMKGNKILCLFAYKYTNNT